MTREEIINEINCILFELDNGEDAVSYLTRNDLNWLNENIKVLRQEPFKPMVEIDLYSAIKQKYIEREVLDKIRAEIQELPIQFTCAHEMQKWALEIIDKYRQKVRTNNVRNSIEDTPRV